MAKSFSGDERRRGNWQRAPRRGLDGMSYGHRVASPVPYGVENEPRQSGAGRGGTRPSRGRGRNGRGRHSDAGVAVAGEGEGEQHYESERGGRGGMRPPRGRGRLRGGRHSDARVAVAGEGEGEQHYESERGGRGGMRPPRGRGRLRGGRHSDARVAVAGEGEGEQHYESERGGRGGMRPPRGRGHHHSGRIRGGRHSDARVVVAGEGDAEQHHRSERGRGRHRGGRGPPSSFRPHLAFLSLHDSDTEGKRRGKYVPTCITLAEIWRLSVLDSVDLVQKVDSRLRDFQASLKSSSLLKKPEEIEAVVCIFLKLTSVANGSAGACSSDTQRAASRIVAELLSERSEAFHFHLKKAVKASTEPQAQRFCELFLALLTTFELSAWSCLPIDELKDAAMTLSKGNPNSDLVKQAQELVETRNQVRDAATNIKQTVKSSTEDNRDESAFKTLPILPVWQEISKDNGIPPEVRPNKVQERYSSWMQYYDIQFRLVREDFIAPLRRGIDSYLQRERGRSLRDVKTYNGVTIHSPEFTRNGICFKVKFDASRFQRTNWDHSKRLIFGSLLCFFPMTTSADVLFATVANRDSRELRDGYFMVQFEDSLAVIPHCNNKTKFEIVESSAYFEATRPILQSLQRAEAETMPFMKQLIEGDCSSVAPPLYLRQNSSDAPPTYNLSCLYGSKRSNRPPLNIQILDEASWSAAHDCELDESQLNAIRMALSQEVAVIQGPPGTGKTYVGLKIVEALLENRAVWDPAHTSPILVMCYTNHALDQFLEGIIETKCHPTVIRIGGRCKNEKVEKCNINKIRTTPTLRHRTSHTFREILQLREELEELNPERIWRKVVTFFKSGRTDLLPLYIIRHVADPDHYYQLSQLATCENLRNKELEVWLDLWEEVTVYPKKEKRSMQDANDHPKKEKENVQPKELTLTRVQEPHHESKCNVAENEQQIETQGGAVFAEKEELIEIQGEAILAGERRMLCDDVEGFKPIVARYDLNSSHSQEQKRPRPMTDSDLSTSEPRWCKKEYADDLIRTYLFKDFMEEEEADQIEDICELSIQNRWRLYNLWAKKRYEYLKYVNKDRFEEYNRLCRELTQAKQREDKIILEQSDVIGMTTTGAAKYQHILHHIKPKIVIVEEAAEVLEAHIVSALSAGTQHLILIGDHKQLRPKPNEHILAQQYKLAISLFERLVIKKLTHATLQIQHRMHPEIARLVCPHVYEKLLNHETVTRYPVVRGICKPLFFIHHTRPEKEDPNLLSFMNEYEAEYIANLCSHFLNLGYLPTQITVLTPYVGQLLKLQSKMPKSKFDGIRITAIDNFQGEENDIILFSMVRSTSDSSKHGTIGFLKEDNRVCVSLSRAKQGFYAIGNFHFIRKHSILWESIISDVERRECLGEALPLYCHNHPNITYGAKLPSDFAHNAPNGGCHLNCEFRLPCGHVCTQKCHIVDSQHEKFKCKKLCARKDSYGHQCIPKHVCCNPCPPCHELVIKTMPLCGHEQEMKCSDDPGSVLCTAPCSNVCDKGHPCPKLCYEDCGHCMQAVEKQIPMCEHKQLVPCYLHPALFRCKAHCSKYCKEGLHLCSKLCYEDCGKCEAIVSKTIPVCGHSQDLPCCIEPKPAICRAICQKVCKNGLHQLQKLCNQDWTPCKEKVPKTMPICGHTKIVSCYKDPSTFRCTNPCEKSCKMGHKCQNLCHEPCGPCVNMVDQELRCGHVHSMQCSTDPSAFKCPTLCLKKLCNNGHRCNLPCHFPRPCEVCKEPVSIVMPKCHHTQMIPCCLSVGSAKFTFHKCDHPCEQKLNCGHKCKKKCGELCEVNCKERVVVTIPCNHTIKTECWRSNFKTLLKRECQKPCHKKLKCGHACREKCNTVCTTNCHEVVVKQLPCGHKSHRPCFQANNFDQYPCDQKCQKKLPCGHKCKNTCGEPCSKCNHKSLQKYPCGHSSIIPCSSTPEMYPCKDKCQTELKCGHKCSGICGECYSSRMHAPCIFDVKVHRYCGHVKTVPCVGLSDWCKQTHQFSCSPTHNASEFRCLHAEDYVQCFEPCTWVCPHFQCKKDCGEKCDRPWCNQPCKKLLSCNHKCPGICGEPCLQVCPECSPDEFQRKLYHGKGKRGRLQSDQLYIELNCGHIFTVAFLDQHMYVDPKTTAVMPQQCPKCHKNIQTTFRYGNTTKSTLQNIMDVDRTVKQYLSIPEDKRHLLSASITKAEEMMSCHGPYLNTSFQRKRQREPVALTEAYLHLHKCRRKLDEAKPISCEEDCFIRCLISFCRLYYLIEPNSSAGLKEILQRLLNVGTTFMRSANKKCEHEPPYRNMYRRDEPIPERKFSGLHLSHQLLDDFKSEIYCLVLLANCAIAGQSTMASSSHGKGAACTSLVEVEDFLQSFDLLHRHISEDEYQKYFEIIRQSVPSHTLIDVHVPSNPPVFKGRWIKCQFGHYYCQPPIIGVGSKVKMRGCPECS